MSSLNDLHQDIWMVILQFFSMEDLLNCSSSSSSTNSISFQNKNSPKLFGISRRIFSSLIGSEIDQEDSHEGGGIFYRVLNEKLVIRQLELVIDRIVNRPIYVNTAGVNDYDEEGNTHNYKPLMEKQRKNEGNRRTRVRRRYYTRSRLNVIGNSQSMSKLRRELRGLIMKCQDQFPHIYENYRNRIDNALERSIKICTMVEKPVKNSDNIEYEDNLTLRTNKPSIWDEEKRRKSIEIPFKSAKNLKNHQWRVQWKFNYVNHLHHELEFHLNYLRTYHNIFCKNFNEKEAVSIEHYMSLVERTLELVFKFGKDFQEKFFTTRNFFRKKKRRNFNNMAENPLLLEKRMVDFIYQTISCLWKSYGLFNDYFSGPKVLDTSIERMLGLIGRLMDIYIHFYGNNTIQEYCYGKSIYDLLIRFDKDLFEKYTSNNELNNLPQHLQISFFISCAKYSSFIPVKLLKSLEMPLKTGVTSTREPISLSDLIINNYYSWDRNGSDGWIAEWLNFLIDKYGKQEVLDSFGESSLREVHNGTRYTTLKNIFGKPFEEKMESIINYY